MSGGVDVIGFVLVAFSAILWFIGGFADSNGVWLLGIYVAIIAIYIETTRRK